MRLFIWGKVPYLQHAIFFRLGGMMGNWTRQDGGRSERTLIHFAHLFSILSIYLSLSPIDF